MTSQDSGVGTFWRRPYQIVMNGEFQTYVRFNYRHYLLRPDNSLQLLAEDMEAFIEKPGRFNGELLEG